MTETTNDISGLIRVFGRVLLTATLFTLIFSGLLYAILWFGLNYYGFWVVEELLAFMPQTDQPIHSWMCENNVILRAGFFDRYLSGFSRGLFFLLFIAAPFLFVWIYARGLQQIRNYYVPELALFSGNKSIIVLLVLTAIFASFFLVAPYLVETLGDGGFERGVSGLFGTGNNRLGFFQDCADIDRNVSKEIFNFIGVSGLSLLLICIAVLVLCMMVFGRYFPNFDQENYHRFRTLQRTKRHELAKSEGILVQQFAGLKAVILIVIFGSIVTVLDQQLSVFEFEKELATKVNTIGVDVKAQLEATPEMYEDNGQELTVGQVKTVASLYATQLENIALEKHIFLVIMVTGKGLIVVFALLLMVSLRFYFRLEASKRSYNAQASQHAAGLSPRRG